MAHSWLSALEERQLADLRFSEVTRALRALSSTYVERRESALADHKALDGAGKRAAFALYYGPIHFLLIQHIVRELGVAFAPGVVVDLGCGTGVAGAAVATSATPPLRVFGVDTHPWTLDEARFTYKAFGLHSDVRRVARGEDAFPGRHLGRRRGIRRQRAEGRGSRSAAREHQAAGPAEAGHHSGRREERLTS